MTLVVPNNSEVIILEYILNKRAPSELDIKLYVNNIIPSETDTVSTYVEASGSGYTTKQLVANSWSISPGNPSTSEHPQVTWVFSGALGNVYGYYIVRRSDGLLMWAEKFTNGPYNVQAAADEIKVTPRLTLE